MGSTIRLQTRMSLRKPLQQAGPLTVFIAAVADQRNQVARFREHGLDHRKIIGVELDAECVGIVGDVLRHAKPSADDYASHRRAIQYVTDAYIGDTCTVFGGNLALSLLGRPRAR